MRLAPAEIRAGTAELVISFLLPEGYKPHRDAPFYLNWAAPNAEFKTRPADADVKNLKFPVDMRVAADQ